MKKIAFVVVSLFGVLAFLDFINFLLAVHYPTAVTIVNMETAHGTSLGGGFFIDPTHIATNAHVVIAAPDKKLRVYDGNDAYPVKVDIIDFDNDIAILEPFGPPKAKAAVPCLRDLKESDSGRHVAVYPRRYELNLENLRSGGVLYGEFLYLRDRPPSIDISHSANIIPGYSGTPLLDNDDCVVGINWGYESPYKSSGVNRYHSLGGLAKPIRFVKEDLDHLLNPNAPVSQASFLGMLIPPKEDINYGYGLVIWELEDDSPAAVLTKYKIPTHSQCSKECGGLTHYLVSVNGNEVDNVAALWGILKKIPPNTKITLETMGTDGNVHTDTVVTKPRNKYRMNRADFNWSWYYF